MHLVPDSSWNDHFQSFSFSKWTFLVNEFSKWTFLVSNFLEICFKSLCYRNCFKNKQEKNINNNKNFTAFLHHSVPHFLSLLSLTHNNLISICFQIKYVHRLPQPQPHLIIWASECEKIKEKRDIFILPFFYSHFTN